VGLGKMFVGGSGGRVFADGSGQWWSGAESGAGAGGELSGGQKRALRDSELR